MPRRPPHFKAMVSAQNHRKMVGVSDDDALLAMWVRAGWLCIERFADRTGDTVLVTRRDLARVAATSPWVNVQRKLRRLVSATPLRLRCDCAADPLRGRCDCAALWLEFPNFAKKHGFKSGNGVETGPYADADADVRKKNPPTPLKRGEVKKQKSVGPKPDRKPHGRPAYTPSPEAEATFDLLLWAIEESLPGASIPDTGSPRWRRWCQELDRLHQLGEAGGKEGFPWEDIRAVIQWLPTHVQGDFAWGRVIRSASKLRKHFARLLAEGRAQAQPVPARSRWRGVAKHVYDSAMEASNGRERATGSRGRAGEDVLDVR